MSDTRPNAEADLLDRATVALRSEGASERIAPKLVAATIEVLKARNDRTIIPQQASEAVRTNSTRRSRMIRIAQWSCFGLATALLLAMTLLWLPGSHGFAQVVKNVKNATSVTFIQKQQAGNQREHSSRCYLQGDQVRIELYFGQAITPDVSPNNILIADFNSLQAMEIDLDEKTYERVAVNHAAMKQLGSPLKWLPELTNENAELIGTEELNGRKTQVYQLKKIDYPLGFGNLDEKKVNRIWIDSETGLPVKIVVNYFDILNKRDTRDVYEDFRWNEPIADELLSLAIPDGYRVIAEKAAETNTK